jgi:nitrite reductase (NO-forming)
MGDMNSRQTNQMREARIFSIVELLVGTLLLLTFLATAGCRTGNADAQQLAGPVEAVQQEYRLRTALVYGRMAFVGAGGDIDGVVNPELTIVAGEPVRIILENGDGMMHDLAIPGLQVQTATTMREGSQEAVIFTAGAPGTFPYFCTVSGHRQAGMAGIVTVTEEKWQ